MRFIAPERLYWFAALLVAAAALVYAGMRRRRELRRLFADRDTAAKATRLSRGGRIVRTALVFAALSSALIAAARPYWKTRRIVVSGSGRDVAVVFDVSKSMWAGDLPPSRLEHAKFMLRQLAEKLPGDRLALVAFAGNAYAACPLTSDRAVFDEYVGELGPELVQHGGTDLEKGLREAMKLLRGAEGTQAIAVLTDGDELTGDSSRVVAELKRRKIPLIVVGLGDPAKPAELPDENGTLRRDRNGRPITSSLNESALKRLAAETNGVYIRSTVADPGAERAAAEIARLAPARYGETEKELPEERFDLFLILAATALALALIVPERSWRRAAVLAAVLMLARGAGAAEKTPEPGTAAPPTAAELYNRGLERHRADDLAGATECFEAVLRRPDCDDRARAKALFNLGAMEHDRARGMIREARDMTRRQELDPAARKLKDAEREFAAVRELYKQALSENGADALDGAAADNLRLYEDDMKRLKELEKAIDELKKQLEKAQRSARNAQQRNRQQEQDKQQQQGRQQDKQQGGQQDKQQGGQQDKPQGGQQDKPQGGQQDKPQGGQQDKPQGGQQDKPQDGQQDKPQGSKQDKDDAGTARRAAAESEKLREQAEKLGQKKLEERARRAAEELRRAEAAPDAQSARPHLDRAVKELDGAGDGAPKPDSGADGKDRSSGTAEKPAERKAPETPQSAAGEKRETPENGRDRMLKMLDDEERRQRRNVRIRREHAPVSRDW